MTTTSTTSTSDGVTATFSIPFPFFSRSHVQVLVDDVAYGGTVTWLSDSLISLSPVPANGVKVTRKRVTPDTPARSTFTNSNINAPGLNANQTQALYHAQEKEAELARALVVPHGEDGLLLPDADTRAGHIMIFDDVGDVDPEGRTLAAFDADVSDVAAAVAATTETLRLARLAAADAVMVSGVNVPIYASVSTAKDAIISAAVKCIETQFYDPDYVSAETLVGRRRQVRTSLADITAGGYSAEAYWRSNTDTYMPDGSSDPVNGGYWLIEQTGARDTTQFGAVPDGTTQTSSVQAAVDALPDYGGTFHNVEGVKFDASALTFKPRTAFTHRMDDDVSVRGFTGRGSGEHVDFQSTSSYPADPTGGAVNEWWDVAPYHPGRIICVRKDISGGDAYLAPNQSRLDVARASFIFADEENAVFSMRYENYWAATPASPAWSAFSAFSLYVSRNTSALSGIGSSSWVSVPAAHTPITASPSGARGFMIGTYDAFVGTGSVAANILTVATATSGAIGEGSVVSGTNITAGSRVLEQVSGTPGGVGTYRLSASSTAALTAVTAPAVTLVLWYHKRFAVGDALSSPTETASGTVTAVTNRSTFCSKLAQGATYGGWSIGLRANEVTDLFAVGGRVALLPAYDYGQFGQLTLSNPALIWRDPYSDTTPYGFEITYDRAPADASRRLTLNRLGSTDKIAHIGAVTMYGNLNNGVANPASAFNATNSRTTTGDYTLTAVVPFARADFTVAMSKEDAGDNPYVFTRTTSVCRIKNDDRNYIWSNTATYDPPSLADGAGANTTVTVTGVPQSAQCWATFSAALSGVEIRAWWSAANTVSVRFQNNTGGTVDLASGTLTVYARGSGQPKDVAGRVHVMCTGGDI